MGLWGDTYKKIADKIVNHLKTGNGKDFNDTIELSTLMLSQQSFKLLIKEISTAFRQKMAISTYDFTLIHSLKENQKKRSDLKNFPFGISYNDSTALKVLVGGVQQLDVILKDIHYQFNKLHHRNDFKYRAEFEITIYDQFGINESDISNASFTASLGMQGLIAFWILQRQRGYKPFRTAFKFNHIINDKF
ncbi:DUF3289 family protein [Pedobacter sp. 22226]|uniref:DUF3289 family protein n=1 Tax=Pedobacter sp. 22226 TaxID=3453894 RepID=UPI003F87CDC8